MQSLLSRDFRVAKFGVVGLANTAIGLGVIYAAKWWGGFGDVVANVLGYGFGLAVSFVLNKVWTFQHAGPNRVALLRFIAVFLVAYAANLATVLFLVRVMRVDGDFAHPVGIIPYTLVFYFGSRYWVFLLRRK